MISLPPQAMRLDLSRMRRIMNTLGNPQDRLPVIHLAGTNGKGSVAAILTSVLSAAGYRVGTLISPHLISPTERILLKGQPTPEADLSETLAHLQDLERSWTQADPDQSLTYFELMVAAGFHWLSAQAVDILIVETGLGGRLDATNVIKSNSDILCINVITSIGLDHTEILGDTVAKIAAEKAGIFKPGARVVLGPKAGIADEAEAVLRQIANQNGVSSLTQARFPESWHATPTPIGWQIARLDRPDRPPFTFPLMGRHQLDNLATTLAVLTAIEPEFPVSEQAFQTGLSAVHWPGRMTPVFQRADDLPLLIIDGSHNPPGLDALLAALELHQPHRRIDWRVSLLKNRDLEAFLAHLNAYPLTHAIQVYCPDPERFHPAPEGLHAPAWPLGFEADVITARSWVNAQDFTLSPPLVVYTGSLYAAGYCLEQIAELTNGFDKSNPYTRHDF